MFYLALALEDGKGFIQVGEKEARRACECSFVIIDGVGLLSCDQEIIKDW